MNTHFCKVGRIRPNLSKLISLKELENKIAYFVEDKSKLDVPEEFQTVAI